ncbi:unnamed protein product, partial [Laminaria digitata]
MVEDERDPALKLKTTRAESEVRAILQGNAAPDLAIDVAVATLDAHRRHASEAEAMAGAVVAVAAVEDQSEPTPSRVAAP